MKKILFSIIAACLGTNFLYAETNDNQEVDYNKICQTKAKQEYANTKLKKLKSTDNYTFLCGEGIPYNIFSFGNKDKYMIIQCGVSQLSYEYPTGEPMIINGEPFCSTKGFGVNFWKKNNKGVYEPIKLALVLPFASGDTSVGDSFNFVKKDSYFTLESEGQPLEYILYYTFKEVNDNIYLDRISEEYYYDNTKDPEVKVYYKYKKGEQQISIQSLSTELIDKLMQKE